MGRELEHTIESWLRLYLMTASLIARTPWCRFLLLSSFAAIVGALAIDGKKIVLLLLGTTK
jgi:hypothetical protein